MNKIKYIGLDVHQASISAAVRDETGKLVMQTVMATRAAAIAEFLDGLRGTLHVTFEEGTYSAWLYDTAGAASQQSGGVQSAQKCSAEEGQQE